MVDETARTRDSREDTLNRLGYILAASHSGSTLLAMLLGAHPDLATVGELKATALGDVERYRCSCGARIRECRFWQEVSRRMLEKGISFDVTDARTDFRHVRTRYTRRLLQPLHRGPILEAVRDVALAVSPSWHRDVNDIQRRNAALVETLCELTGARAIVDSSKVALRVKYLLRNPDLDVRVIHLVRDGRAVALTYMDPADFADASIPELRGGGMGGDRAKERLSAADAAYEWLRSNQEAEAALARLGSDRFIRIRYEDLCRDTDVTLAGVFRLLGVDPARRERDFRSVEHHVIGNGMRLDTSSEVRLDERWRTAMRPEHLAEFERVAGAMNRAYGYT